MMVIKNKQFTPTGNRRHYNNTLTTDIKTKIQTSKHLRSQIPAPANITRIRINIEVDRDIKKQWRECGQNTLTNIKPVKVRHKYFAS